MANPSAAASQPPAAPPPAAAAQPGAGRPGGFVPPPAHTGPVTALQLVDRIRAHAAAPAPDSPPDEIVAGDPTTAITGIATTPMATFDCLKAAAAAGKNLIVTLESTFWSDNDSLDRLEGSALFKAKRDFIRANNLVCFHLHDHWPAQGPNGIATGMARELGWESYVVDPAAPTSFKLPPTTLLGLAQELGKKLNDRTMRIVGDPRLPVTAVAAKWGNAVQIPTIHLLNSPVDVVLVGYTFEWESVEYAQDMVAAGGKKGLILLGESKSQQGGMRYCAEWLKTFITEVPIECIPVAEPYWNPQNPVFERNTKV
jgi:hypothetical protein